MCCNCVKKCCIQLGALDSICRQYLQLFSPFSVVAVLMLVIQVFITLKQKIKKKENTNFFLSVVSGGRGIYIYSVLSFCVCAANVCN